MSELAKGTLARRLKAGLAVGVLSILALVALVLVLGISESPSFRYRVDLSEVRRNSLDPSTEDLLQRLEEPVTAHVFFRAESTAIDAAVSEARARFMDLFLVARGVAPDRFEFIVHDLDDVAAAGERMRALGLDKVNAVVFEAGDEGAERRSIVPVDAASLDITPDPVNPSRYRLRDFRGEEQLQQALLKLSVQNRKRVLVATGHGERDVQAEDELGMDRLGRELAGDGFDVAVWDPLENGPIGEDVDILFIAAPRDAYSEDELAMVRDFVERGGRLLVIAGQRLFQGAGSTGELLAPYGMLARPGIIAAPTLSQDLGGVTVGFAKCADFFVREAGLNSSHEITRPIWEAALRVRAIQTRSFERGQAPPGGSLQSLLTLTDRGTWLDLPLTAGQYDPGGRYNWAPDPGRERTGSASLAMAAEFPVGDAPDDLELDDPRRRSRVVGIAMPEMASNALFQANNTANRDFLLNCFNWLAERDFSVRVSMQQEAGSTLDLYRGTEVITLRRFAWWGLPGLLALVGLVLAWRRRG